MLFACQPESVHQRTATNCRCREVPAALNFQTTPAVFNCHKQAPSCALFCCCARRVHYFVVDMARAHTNPRLPHLWVCATHKHRQCATCAAVGRGVRHCCARGHVGHPRPPAQERSRPPGAPGRARAAGLRTPGGGGDPSAKRPKRRQQGSVQRGQASKGGRGHPDPPPRSGRE